jgi:hypothetical protein
VVGIDPAFQDATAFYALYSNGEDRIVMAVPAVRTPPAPEADPGPTFWEHLTEFD